MPNLLWKVEALEPAKLSDRQREQFIQLVERGGGVDPIGLAGRVARAYLLLTITDNDGLAAAAAIKNQPEEYRLGHFTKAGVQEMAADYPFELGWIVVDTAYQGRHCVRPLVEHALEAVSGVGLYATTRSDRIRRVLADYNFILAGNPYDSEIEQHAKLTLHVRAAQ